MRYFINLVNFKVEEYDLQQIKTTNALTREVILTMGLWSCLHSTWLFNQTSHKKKHPNTAISTRHQYHKLNQRPISYLQTEATLYFKYDFHTYSTKQCIDSQIWQRREDKNKSTRHWNWRHWHVNLQCSVSFFLGFFETWK